VRRSGSAESAEAYIRERTDIVPDTALILGSGLGGLADEIHGISIPYGDIPGFPVSTAPSHAGVLHIGQLAGRSVVAMSGRVHMYEGYSAGDVAFPVHVMAGLGAKTLVVTNASGGLSPGYAAGDLMILEDHLSLPGLAGADPTRGAHDPSLGPRFTSLNEAYDRALAALALARATALKVNAHRGTYGFVVGPALETPAEVRALRMLGCDAVGMSTVPEVIAARQRGLDVLAISAICNIAVDSVDSEHVTTAEEVFEALTTTAPTLQHLVTDILKHMPTRS